MGVKVNITSCSGIYSFDQSNVVPGSSWCHISHPSGQQKKTTNLCFFTNKSLPYPTPSLFVLCCMHKKEMENGSVMKKRRKKEGKETENSKTPCRLRIWREAIVWPPCLFLQSDSLSGACHHNSYFLLTFVCMCLMRVWSWVVPSPPFNCSVFCLFSFTGENSCRGLDVLCTPQRGNQ